MAKKIKNYSEAELIELFGLERNVGNENNTLLLEWTSAKEVDFSIVEKFLFDEILNNAIQHIGGWQEEDLKMKFISFVLRLGHLQDTPLFNTYFEKTIWATVEGNLLKTKTDFMVAKGILDMPQKPYFHFQEWKPHKRPTGDSMAQLLEAFLIAQEVNKNNKPLYGCEVVGKAWNFVVMEHKNYCISKSYDCTDNEDLMQIIAILRKFKEILETRLLD
jgi:hypothetical protein